MAGAIVAVMIVPQSMAYAMLAGLPAEVGLYSSLLPLAVYAVMGAIPSMSVGPTALVSLLVAATVGRYAPDGGAEAVAITATLALLVGTLQLAMGLLRLGFVVNFLSHPVVAGFTAAAVVVIGLSQYRVIASTSPLRRTCWKNWRVCMVITVCQPARWQHLCKLSRALRRNWDWPD